MSTIDNIDKDEKALYAVEQRPVDSHDLSPEYVEYQQISQKFDDDRVKALCRKTDFYIIPPLLLIYLLSYIDRSNVGNIKLFGAEADMNLTPTDWNIGLSLLFVTFSIGGPACNALVKMIGPRITLSATFFGVAVTIFGLGFANNRAEWFALRLLLGLFEGGIWPCGVFVLTTWYTPSQLGFRLSVFYLGGALSGAFSGLLAYGIGQLDGVHGWRGWRWILVIEGGFSMLVAIAAFFWISETPANASSRMFSEEEKRFIVLRARFTYGSSQSGSKDDFTWKDFASCLKSWHVWIIGFSDFAFCVAIYGFALTLPTIIKNMGFSAANAQALSAPPCVFAVLCLLPCGYFSDKYRARMWSVVLPSLLGFVGLVICLTTADKKHLVPLTYIGCCLAAGGMYCLAPALSTWMGLNTAGQAKRAASIAFGVTMTQFGGIVGSNIYLAAEKPTYPLGFGLSLSLLFVGCVILPFIYRMLIDRVNKQREAMSTEEIMTKYTAEELTAMGDMSPFYRYER